MKTHIARPENNNRAWRTGCASRWLLVLTVALGPLMAQDWPMFGQNPANTANNATETGISVKTAPSLGLKWTFTTGGDVSARAAVVNGVVYFPDWGGNLW